MNTKNNSLIKSKETELHNLKQALEVCLHPPIYPVDRTRMPLIDRAEEMLQSSKDEAERQQRISALQRTIQEAQSEIERLKRVAEVEAAKAELAEIEPRIHEAIAVCNKARDAYLESIDRLLKTAALGEPSRWVLDSSDHKYRQPDTMRGVSHWGALRTLPGVLSVGDLGIITFSQIPTEIKYENYGNKQSHDFD